MAQVLGIGGVFFKTQDPKALMDWYARVLGFSPESWGGAVFPSALAGARPGAYQVFGPFAADTTYFDPSTNGYMINLMVDDLDGMLAHAASEGVLPQWRNDDDPHGRFAHLIDPQGGKIELWEPKETG